MTARRRELIVNSGSVVLSGLLIALFVWHEAVGRIRDVTYVFYPILLITIVFGILTINQFHSAVQDGSFWRIPVPIRWVLFAGFGSFAALLAWIIINYFFVIPYEADINRLLWLQAGLAFVWVGRRFLLLDIHEAQQMAAKQEGAQ